VGGSALLGGSSKLGGLNRFAIGWLGFAGGLVGLGGFVWLVWNGFWFWMR
jgi:hypothetical protein